MREGGRGREGRGGGSEKGKEEGEREGERERGTDIRGRNIGREGDRLITQGSDVTLATASLDWTARQTDSTGPYLHTIIVSFLIFPLLSLSLSPSPFFNHTSSFPPSVTVFKVTSLPPSFLLLSLPPF